MLNFELVAKDTESCTILERATGAGITNEAPLPASKHAVVALMKKMLRDPDCLAEEDGNISVSRTRDELRLVVGITQILIKWPHVFPIVLA